MIVSQPIDIYLDIVLRIPVAVKDDYCICCSQVDAYTTSPGGQEENETVGVLIVSINSLYMKRSRKSDEIEKMILKRSPCRKRAEIGDGKEDSKQEDKEGEEKERESA